ncbi:MAG: outer membrane beta-barrel protein, partial [Deltaproteobacteria bacterium]|nr:outer membrane beta-barrel protein [Deltaproteobacteria bacterium]
IGYRFRYNPQSTFFMHYDFTNRDFKGNTIDYKVYEGTLGLEKNISQDMSYRVSAGYFLRKNDLGEDDDGLNADISFTKTIDRGAFNITGRSGWSEAYLEAESRGFTRYQSVTTSFSYRVTENLSNNISLSYRQDKAEASRKSKTLGTGYGWSWAFLRYYSISLDYTCSVRDDDIDTSDYLVNRVMFSLRWSRPYR